MTGDRRPLADRRPVALFDDQEGWLAEQEGSRSAVLRELVDRAMGTATHRSVRETLLALLAELDERGTWLRGSPGELLQDLEADDPAVVDLVDSVQRRMR